MDVHKESISMAVRNGVGQIVMECVTETKATMILQLCSILDGYSRSIVHWDLRESMTEAEIQVILQRAREKYPEAKPRIISDNVLTSECIRPGTPLTIEDAVRLIQTYVDHYNTVRLHSAIGYVTRNDMLAGRQTEIHAARDRKLTHRANAKLRDTDIGR